MALRGAPVGQDLHLPSVDFVIQRPEGQVDAIEAEINPDAFDAANLTAFRQLYPAGKNFLFCPFVKTPYTLTKNGLLIEVRATAQD